MALYYQLFTNLLHQFEKIAFAWCGIAEYFPGMFMISTFFIKHTSLLAEVSDSEKRERPLPAPDEFSVAHALAFPGNE